jgi:hypothetical protein
VVEAVARASEVAEPNVVACVDQQVSWWHESSNIGPDDTKFPDDTKAVISLLHPKLPTQAQNELIELYVFKLVLWTFINAEKNFYLRKSF